MPFPIYWSYQVSEVAVCLVLFPDLHDISRLCCREVSIGFIHLCPGRQVIGVTVSRYDAVSYQRKQVVPLHIRRRLNFTQVTYYRSGFHCNEWYFMKR